MTGFCKKKNTFKPSRWIWWFHVTNSKSLQNVCMWNCWNNWILPTKIPFQTNPENVPCDQYETVAKFLFAWILIKIAGFCLEKSQFQSKSTNSPNPCDQLEPVAKSAWGNLFAKPENLPCDQHKPIAKFEGKYFSYMQHFWSHAFLLKWLEKSETLAKQY